MLNAVLWIAGIYALICVGAVFFHRHFVYVPDPTRFAPADAGLRGVEEITMTVPDGVKLIAWYARAKGGKPTLLYFTGNGGNTASRAGKIETIMADGYGVFMLNYRGYGGSDGKPTEANNLADAEAAYDKLVSLGAEPKDIVAYGESLGTFIATRLALVRPVRALVLEAPFTSIVDVGRQSWWFLPLNLVMLDQYRTIDHIGKLAVPLFIIHGERDSIIPIDHARRVYAAAPEPKRLLILPGGDHNDMFEQGAWSNIRAFLETLDSGTALKQPKGEGAAQAEVSALPRA